MVFNFVAIQALVRAYRSSNSKPIYKPLYRQCCGVLFSGVPHLGLRSEALTTIVNGQPNQALIDSIKVDKESEPSHFLRRISEDFARCFTGETRVVSFYECHRSPTIEVSECLHYTPLTREYQWFADTRLTDA